MQKLIAFVMLVVGSSAIAMAVSVVPEIDPTSGVNAVALIVGGLLILRSHRKK